MSIAPEHIPHAPELSPVAQAAMERTHWIASVDLEIDRVWPWIEGAIANGMPYGVVTHTKDDIKSMIINNDAQLWTTPNGACVTCVTVYPRASILQIWLMGGDYNELMTKHFSAVNEWAKSIGASLMYVQGRKGWIRRLNRLGFEQHQAITCLEIKNGRTVTFRSTEH
jgi:hypothetical protein